MAQNDSETNMEVIGVTARASLELAGLFGFEIDFGGDEMMALQDAIYMIFGKQINEGRLNSDFAAKLRAREQQD
jgi:hypothetical protein